MKIAMIGQKGVPVQSGGVERHVEELGKRLVQRGHEVIIYNRLGYAEYDGNEYLGMKLKNIFTIKNKGLEAIIYSFLASFDSLFNNFDIIHFHALGPATMSFIPKIFNKKVVVTVHGLDWQREKWGKFAKLYLKLGEKASIYIPNRTITVSRKLKEYYEANYNKKVYYIPNGINMPKIVSSNNIKNYGLEKRKYILFLARIVPEKGCHYLLDAFSKLNTDLKLVIAGGSSYTDTYYRSLKKYESRNIIFIGEVVGEFVNELYSNALFYVLPSEIEGLPIGLLEAMSYGLCPLVSDIEENMEVIKANMCYGISFRSQNTVSLKEKLIYMINNHEYITQIGKAAQEYVLQMYNWDNAVNQLENLYKDTIKGKTKGSNFGKQKWREVPNYYDNN